MKVSRNQRPRQIPVMYSLILLPLCFGLVWGHAALYEPPGRSSMWRFGFKTPVNDDDAELYCGGITKLWKINKGKCGICGDAWDLPEPRPNEDGGKYGKGIVVRTYKAGQEFTSTVDCFLDQHPVGLADGSGNRYFLKRGIKGNLDIKLKLPNGLKCDRCVLQYHWKAANNWGICEDGKGRMGCGPQEYFRACADIRIE
ncbi:chitin-binding type-4 domain-containing protein [Trichonephila inaurata madagascariensis]|uniref:Chitin-binding type-4 domain-containing protein n=1 Tax=Trichonephila inaurata madagascariensis TaxID=2747483 RepID=A0A8X6YIC9_9ARAC|nr:chitin-binding type-4 domain-containing protein [Trichonephila inaurata madagascariensis]